jgi:hypothetical protein
MAEENPEVVVCTDCGSNGPPKDNDFMLWQTGQGLCKLCGGSTRLIRQSQLEALLRSRRNGKVIP